MWIDRRRADPSAFTDRENWAGGYYELAVELGTADDERLQRALTALWRAAGISGCYARRDREPGEQERVACTVASLERYGPLRGTVVLPNGRPVVCCCVAVREDGGPDWLDFDLPMGALARAGQRIGDRPGGGKARSRRRVLDDWLAGIAASVFESVAFRLGLIGYEVSGRVYAHELGGTAPADRWEGYLLPAEDGLRYEPADR